MIDISKSTEGSSSSSSNNHDKHDVFLSFRGVDTRNGFTDHLHKALLDANISTFLDEEEIETGGDLNPELESAIKESRAFIIVLSKNYANSSWCLDELALILGQRTSNKIVIPVFFHVEPTDVRNQTNTFGLSIAEHKKKLEAESNENKRSQLAQKIERWIKALSEVSNLKGFDAKGRRETKFIAEIVEDIYCKLHVPVGSAAPPLIGMEDSIKFVTSWLRDASSDKGDVLTILGMGGIGKTSLAKYVYGLHFREFDTRSYIEDISRRCVGKYNGLLDLTKQLCDDISKRIPIQVYDVSVYTSKIGNALANKKVLLVLDDINSLEELDALLGNKGFHPGSKIIITTRNAWLTKSALFKMEVGPRHVEHWLQGLDKTQSLQLLCSHAFKSEGPMEGYEIVSKKIVKYCRGHPLTLEVLGKSLHKQDVAYWEERIEGLGKENFSRITDVLKTSYNSLPSRNDKELFKHIACFFVGTDRDFCDTILTACDIKTRSGITNLIDRCLLSIGWNNELVMHQLLQEMGRFIVCEESPDKPSRRSRLWCHEDSSTVLKQKKGTENTRGLTLDTRMLNNERLHETYELEPDAISKMDSLMLLQLNYVTIKGSYENFPGQLRWLCMHGFPLNSIPSDLPMENLVALDMSDSKITSFGICCLNQQPPEKRQKLLSGSCSKGKRLLGSLKILNLSFCKELFILCGFDGLPALERLIVTNCSALLEVCESIEQCVDLAFIDLSYCNNLNKFPQTIGMLKKVKTLFLDGCNLSQSQIEIRDMDSPEELKANNITINRKNCSSAILKAIPCDSKFLTISLPRSLVRLSLKNNNLSTKSFPMDFSRLSMLEELYLDGNPIVSLPNCVRSLPRLEILSGIADGATCKEEQMFVELYPKRKSGMLGQSREGSSCGFVGWFDTPMCGRSKQIIPGLLRKINRLERNALMLKIFLIGSWTIFFIVLMLHI